MISFTKISTSFLQQLSDELVEGGRKGEEEECFSGSLVKFCRKKRQILKILCRRTFDFCLLACLHTNVVLLLALA